MLVLFGEDVVVALERDVEVDSTVRTRLENVGSVENQSYILKRNLVDGLDLRDM